MPVEKLVPSNRVLLTASFAAEAHLEAAQHALEQARLLLDHININAASMTLAADASDAVRAVMKLRAKLDIFKKRIP